MARDYEPFANGVTEHGSNGRCPICGVQVRNQHSLRESAKCDWMRRPADERARILAEREKEVA